MTRPILIALVIGVCYVQADARTERFVVSSYCQCQKCCGPKAKGITASGKVARVGMCAAPRRIPFGTVLYVSGYGRAVVEDRLAQKYDGRIDVFAPRHDLAKKWGKRHLNVKVIR